MQHPLLTLPNIVIIPANKYTWEKKDYLYIVDSTDRIIVQCNYLLMIRAEFFK